MKKIKLILYILIAIYLAITVLLVINQDMVLDRFNIGIIQTINYLTTWLAFGMVLFLLEVIVENIHITRLKRKLSRIEKDNLNLKAKLFDQEEEKKEFDRNIQSFEDSIQERPAEPTDGDEEEEK